MLRPLKSKVIAQLIQKPTTTASGIILTTPDSEEASRGLILAIGADVTEVVVGDYILPNWNKAQKTKTDDADDVYIIEEDDIILVFGEIGRAHV